ncbi:DUF4919 domain-containing protein [Flavobacterium caeni]|uniref:DUF4919 domain-containing protein n=1 Tax=Flavobacterium caeni TaxID=490189 RepID=A0A1G5K9Y3_9FLAO|nr:DUF4919 domain-containing protein [Flavobacterium caeni]SCY96820.1 protein of unknown function [Flavobacterium caeni]
MKNTWLVAVLLVSTGLFAQTTFNYKTDHEKMLARTKDAKDALFYDTQLQRFKAHDTKQTDTEVLSMLVAYAKNPEFNPLKDSFRESIVQELMTDQKYEDALGMANKLLKGSPFDIKGIYHKATILRKLEQNDSAKAYDKQWQKILKAMFLSGNGTSMANPTFSLGPDDGSVFIGLFIGAEVTGRKTEKNPEGQTVAVYEALLEKKRKLTLYFLIDDAQKRWDEESKKK